MLREEHAACAKRSTAVRRFFSNADACAIRSRALCPSKAKSMVLEKIEALLEARAWLLQQHIQARFSASNVVVQNRSKPEFRPKCFALPKRSTQQTRVSV
eukprot:1379850-Pleurochrysis_carterae.AAC.1